MTIRVGILIVSDRSARGERPDAAGPAIAERVQSLGWQTARREIVPDDLEQIQEALTAWCDGGDLDLVLTSGGTGFSPRDNTPEATLAVIEREAPGLAEAMRAASLQSTPYAMLSRAVAGIRRRTIVVNLPGSPRGALECLQVIAAVMPHAAALLREDPDAEAGHRHLPA